MTEYSRMAKGSFTATGTSAVVVLPFMPDYVELWNYSNIKTVASASRVTRAWWDNKLIDTATGTNPTMLEGYTTGPVTTWDQVQNANTTPGINVFQGGIALQFGPTQTVTTLTGSASPTIITVTGHGYQVGDTIVMTGIPLGTNNFQLLNGVWFTITAVTTNTFSIQWDSSGGNYTTESPSGVTVRKVLYPFLYLPEDNVVTAVTRGASTTIVTSTYHNFFIGQEIAFRVPPLWGITQLNSLPDLLIPGQPIYGYVTSITDNWTFVCSFNSTNYTAFTNNFAMTSATLPGLTYMQVVAVGDVNTGGESLINANLPYQSPLFPTSTNRVGTINGPAIRGSFVNNTSQGFTIGSGAPAGALSATTIVANTNIIYWHAYLHDYASP